MPVRKPTAKKAHKVTASKQGKRTAVIFPLDLPGKERNPILKRSRRNGAQIGRFWSYVYGDEISEIKDKNIVAGRIPNPWPSDIVRLIEVACHRAGLATIVYKTIKLWFDARNAKRIRIKNGDVEVEIQGGMSEREIEKRINQFRRLTEKLDEDDIKVILPPRVNRSLPSKQAGKKKGSKK